MYISSEDNKARKIKGKVTYCSVVYILYSQMLERKRFLPIVLLRRMIGYWHHTVVCLSVHL